MSSKAEKINRSAAISEIDKAVGQSPSAVRLIDGVVLIAKTSEQGSARRYRRIDLRHRYLPKTPFSSVVISIAERPELVSVVLEAVQIYTNRVSKSKSFDVVVSRIVNVACKFIEYGWLHGRYLLRDWTPQLTHRLAQELSQGGWARALNLESRAKEGVSAMTIDQAKLYLSKREDRRGGSALQSSYMHVLGTSAQKRELHCVKQVLSNFLGETLTESILEQQRGQTTRSWDRGMSVAHLEQELWVINIFSDLSAETGLQFTAFPDLARTSRQLGRPNKRTENLGPAEVGRLLQEAQRWQRDLTEPVINLWDEMCVEMERRKPARSDEVCDLAAAVLTRSKNRPEIERLLRMPLRGMVSTDLSRQEISLAMVTYALITSCFLTITIFNARRKDEVQHRDFGLQMNSLVEIDEAMGLYQCWFYREKKHQSRAPFYVNAYTRRSIHVLQQTSELARRFIRICGKDTSNLQGLFLIPRVTGLTSRLEPHWYEFGTSLLGPSKWFVSLALGDEDFRLKAHMMRRAHALLYHYRYEHGTFTALAQQFGHFDLDSLHIYVTDVERGAAARGADMYAKIDPEQRRAIVEDASHDVLVEIQKVGRERIENFVREVIEGAADYSGGFKRLVQRFHQRMGIRVDYQKMSARQKTKAISDLLIARGHEFKPYPHGNCAAASAKRNPSAGCSSRTDRMLLRENAAPITCARCPYHVVTETHVNLLEQQLESLAETIKLSEVRSIAYLRAKADRSNLTRIIRLHRDTLSKREVS